MPKATLERAKKSHAQAQALRERYEAATHEAKVAVRDAKAAGWSVVEIAEALGVHRVRVYQMIRDANGG